MAAEIFCTNSSSSSPARSLTAHRSRTFFRPVADIIALDRLVYRAGMLGPQALRHEQIDQMFAALIDDRGHRLAGDIIEPAAK
jgi:hypothetical protein